MTAVGMWLVQHEIMRAMNRGAPVSRIPNVGFDRAVRWRRDASTGSAVMSGPRWPYASKRQIERQERQWRRKQAMAQVAVTLPFYGGSTITLPLAVFKNYCTRLKVRKQLGIP